MGIAALSSIFPLALWRAGMRVTALAIRRNFRFAQNAKSGHDCTSPIPGGNSGSVALVFFFLGLRGFAGALTLAAFGAGVAFAGALALFLSGLT